MSLQSFKPRPKLIVFDLDYTLWPFWVDTHVSPPFKMKGSKVVDSQGQEVKHYAEVPEVLRLLSAGGYLLGVASRTGEIAGANQLLDLFGWDKYFQFKEIYPGRKVTHFTKIRKDSGVPFSEMVFFDDEARNIRDLAEQGVVSVLVHNGVSKKVVEKGLKQFSEGVKR
ncbi:magnesium-dependent phosphatase 1-like [Bacillus rossius redtenbacheri]|uniref:magnesium-dependent phosphatase 1-like n=1 Tax=Bacillus rossius redtenbacheri TaxID=93214 RepID=UPI002FDEFF17